LLARANSKSLSEKLTGQYIQVTGADSNLYLLLILKAMREYIQDECNGYLISSDTRLVNKIESARMLCDEDRMNLVNINIKITG
jgi:hypothetical protein